MNIGIIAIGDELLIGQVIDTNSSRIGLLLGDQSLLVRRKWTVGDSYTEIQYALQQASEDLDIIITSGGLGPTKDDISKKALADFLGDELVFSEENYEHLQKMFAHRNIIITDSHKQQCLVPKSAKLLPNKVGTAMGIWVDVNDKTIIMLPGVPDELNYIMSEEVIPRLRERRRGLSTRHITFNTAGVGETDIANRIEPALGILPEHIRLAYLPSIAQVKLRLSGSLSDPKQLEHELDYYSTIIKNTIPDIIFGEGITNLALELGKLLISKNLKIGTVESCTGGSLASKFTSNPGSSDYFKSGLVTYATESKEKILGISKEIIDQYNVVSEEVVKEMVRTGTYKMNVDFVIATTGIAGPSGGTDEIPVGTIFIACGNAEMQFSKKLRFGKNRDRNIEATSVLALNFAREILNTKF